MVNMLYNVLTSRDYFIISSLCYIFCADAAAYKSTNCLWRELQECVKYLKHSFRCWEAMCQFEMPEFLKRFWQTDKHLVVNWNHLYILCWIDDTLHHMSSALFYHPHGKRWQYLHMYKLLKYFAVNIISILCC